MKKTFPVNISGKIFYIDEDAYELLFNYLDQLRSAFSQSEGEEIITDIESRIAELFDEQISTGANAIVYADVNRVIEIMGKPSDITDCGDPAPDPIVEQQTSRQENAMSGNTQKKLYRTTSNKVFGGVLGGLADYLGWNANIMRILTVLIALSSFFWPPIIVYMVFLYLIAWMVIPPLANSSRPTNNNQQTEIHNKKSLYRNLNNKVFGGVIGGLAVYLGWDANIMRILLVIISIPTYVWPMALLYLVAWMVIPPANTPRRILELHGSPVTVDSIGQNVLSSTPPPYFVIQENNNFLAKCFSILGKCIIGFLGLIGAVGALVATGFFLFLLAALVAYSCFNSIDLIGTIVYNVNAFPSSLGPTVFCLAFIGLALCIIIPGIALAWGAAAIIFNCKGAAKITIITALILEVIFIVATIILFIFANRLHCYF